MTTATDGRVVRTVLGDIAPDALGPTDYHEHLLMRSPLLPGDALDDIGRSSAETRALAAAGISALVELTPIGLGRDPAGLATIARATGVHIVAATGVHREAHSPPAIPFARSTNGRSPNASPRRSTTGARPVTTVTSACAPGSSSAGSATGRSRRWSGPCSRRPPPPSA